MSELGPSSVESDPISIVLLENNPEYYSAVLYKALSSTDWVNHIQDIKDEEMKAVCVFCAEYHPFIDLAFDELISGDAIPDRFHALWDLIANENFAISTLNKYNLGQGDVPALRQEQKRRQRAIAFGYQLDKFAVINVNLRIAAEARIKSA